MRSKILIFFLVLTPLLVGGCEQTSHLTEQEHIQKAKEFEAKGDLKAAIINLKNALEKNPQSPQPRWLLGELYVKVGDGAAAEKELKKARELGVSEESIKLPLGRALLIRGEYKRLLDEIQVGSGTSTTNQARILQIRGDAMMGLQLLAEACELYQQSVTTEPQPLGQNGLARCAIARGEPDQAKAYLRKALELDPNYAPTLILFGDIERLQGNTKEALAAYTAAIKHDPTNPSALFNRALIATQERDYSAVQRDVATLRSANSKGLHWRYLQAIVDYRQNKHAEAQAQLQEVLKGNPNYTPALLLSGAVAYAQGRNEEAEANLGKVLRIAPGTRFARLLLASTQSKLGQTEQAMQTLAPLHPESTDDSNLLALAGSIYFTAGNYGKASEYFRKAVEHNPRSSAMRGGLGVARLAQGETQQALQDLEAAAAFGERLPGTESLLVSTYLRTGQPDKALQALDALEKKSAASPFTLNFRGAAYVTKKDYARARQNFEKALNIQSSYLPALLNLAQLDLLDKNPQAARKRFEEILKYDASNTQAMLALAKLSANAGERLIWLQRAAGVNSKSLDPSRQLVRYHLEAGEPAKALIQARQAQSAQPSRPEALELLGRAQLAAGEKENAASTFSKLASLAPDSPLAHFKLAQAQLALGKLKEAEASLKNVLALQPGNLDAETALVVVHLRQGRFDEAISIALQVQRQLPRSALGWTLEGDIQAEKKHYTKAAVAYRKAIELQPSSLSVISLHRAETLSGDVKNADARLLKWLERQPADIPTRAYLAGVYLGSGRSRDAIKEYEVLLKQAPDHVLALNNLANLYLQEKDSRALATAERAYKLWPNNPVVADTLGWILAEQGQAARAVEILRQAAAAAPNNPTTHYHLAVALAKAGDHRAAKQELRSLLAGNRPFAERESARALLKQP